MKADSSSMKIIAVMTLVFLPCTAVAVSSHVPSLRDTISRMFADNASDNLQYTILLFDGGI